MAKNTDADKKRLRTYTSGVDLRHLTTKVLKHWMLMLFALVSTAPVALVVINSMKARRAIFKDPYHLPNADTFDLVGYETVIEKAQFHVYYFNSLFVTPDGPRSHPLVRNHGGFCTGRIYFPGQQLAPTVFPIGYHHTDTFGLRQFAALDRLSGAPSARYGH